MRFIYTITLASLIFFFGCDQGTDITSPGEIDNHSYQFIKLPKRSGMSVENTFSVTKEIDGMKGGEIKLKGKYVAEDGHTVKIDVKLKVKSKSFQGKANITMTVDDEFAAASFTPAMVFNKPLELDMKFEGINLGNLDPTDGVYEFAFYDEDGTTDLVDYNAIHVKESKGKIWVNKAKVYHFSRYGFVN